MIKQRIDQAGRQPAPLMVLAAAGVLGGLALVLARSGESRVPTLAERAQRRLSRISAHAADRLDEGTEALEDGVESVRRHVPSIDLHARAGQVREAAASTTFGERTVALVATTLLAGSLAGYLRWRDERHARGRAAARARHLKSATSLEEHTVAELRRMASEQEIEGRSSMNKDELVEALTEGKSSTSLAHSTRR